MSPERCAHEASQGSVNPRACRLLDTKTMVSPERPDVDRGHFSPSWSVRRLAGSQQCGTAVSTKKKLHPSVLQTSEFREGILLPSITRRRLEHGIAHANSFDTSANPPMKPSQIGLPATASS